MDVTFVVNEQDLAPVLSTYRVVHTPEYETTVQTMDRKKHHIGKAYRTSIIFSLFPFADTYMEDSRALLETPLMVKFTDSEYGTVRMMEFDMTTELARQYGMKSVNGANYYSGNEITMEALEVDNANNIEYL